ncbi:hypothetical protein BW899_06680 [Bacillus mycoides]|uniref:hypothetical protein n=1 Tax=Bacillus TaxID=1386 RepID=UPI000993902F|nr:hypothetical protein [Bacillus mycoides]OOR01647.1 hypothetical protein BW899_06680 [Bacillus mycoides]HDR7585522.1 hypothetical protein [Bacillus mycoides]
MNDDLNKNIDYVTKTIKRACNKYPKDNERQYKAFMYVMRKVNDKFNCSQERYLDLRRMLAIYTFFRDDTVEYEYEKNVCDLLGVYIPIHFV